MSQKLENHQVSENKDIGTDILKQKENIRKLYQISLNSAITCPACHLISFIVQGMSIFWRKWRKTENISQGQLLEIGIDLQRFLNKN